MSEEKYIGKAKMKEQPSKPFLFKLKEGTVFLRHLAEEVLDKFNVFDNKINDIEIHLTESTENLQNQINSLEIAGVALSNGFGDNKNIGISQWALSHWARAIQQRLDTLTGENSRGMYMTTSKDYVVGYRGKINITASCANIQGIFDHIAIYANNQLIAEQDATPFLEHEIKIKETTVITCVAKIMGEEFTESKTISYFKKAFYLGGGKTYNDIFNMEHLYALENGSQRGSYNIQCNQGDHIIILLDNALGEEFIAAYMDGFLPIPFTQEDIIIDGDSYHLLMSENIYAADTYNVIIDVNSPEPMPVSPELAWSAESATVIIGADDNVYPTLSNPNDVTVTYSSSDENVATINENAGAISLVEAGETTITAAFVGDDTYEPQVVSYALTVNAAPEPEPEEPETPVEKDNSETPNTDSNEQE